MLVLFNLVAALMVLNPAGLEDVAHVRVPKGRTEAMRDWSNANGSRSVRAVLLHIDGEKLSLRTAAGRTATTTVENLSAADREYLRVSMLGAPRRENSVANSTLVPIHNAALQPPTAVTQFASVESDQCPRKVPAVLVHVRISRKFLEGFVERNIDQQKPVRDCILGTSIFGESTTRGNIRLFLEPSFGKLSGKIAFDGTVHSPTVGYNGPATIHSVSNATFASRKQITLNASGVHVTAAQTSAPTVLSTTGIETSLPRLRGRIAQRIASRRNASSHCQAQAITAEHIADRISKDFDERIEISMARVKQVLSLQVPELQMNRESDSETRYRSTANFVEMALIRSDACKEDFSLRPPPVPGEPDIAIRVNRSMFGTTIGDSDLTKELAPLLVQLLHARVITTAAAIGGAELNPPEDSAKWSLDKDWLSMDFTDLTDAAAPRGR